MGKEEMGEGGLGSGRKVCGKIRNNLNPPYTTPHTQGVDCQRSSHGKLWQILQGLDRSVRNVWVIWWAVVVGDGGG